MNAELGRSMNADPSASRCPELVEGSGRRLLALSDAEVGRSMNAERPALSDAEGCRSMEIATEVPIELKAGKVLKIFLLNKEYNLTDFQGLKVIEAPSIWLQDISPRKLRTLKGLGFTGETKVIIYKNKIGYFKKEARRFKEWVAIWAYFASMGNTKAAEILTLLIVQDLETRMLVGGR